MTPRRSFCACAVGGSRGALNLGPVDPTANGFQNLDTTLQIPGLQKPQAWNLCCRRGQFDIEALIRQPPKRKQRRDRTAAPCPRDRQAAVRRPFSACKPLARGTRMSRTRLPSRSTIRFSIMFHFMGSAHSIAPFRAWAKLPCRTPIPCLPPASAACRNRKSCGRRQEGAGLSIALCRLCCVLGFLQVPPLF